MEEENYTVTQNEPEEELDFFSKVTGVFSSPSATFGSMAKFKLRASDYLLPIIIFIIGALLANYLMMNNPTIHDEMMNKQKEQIKKSMDEQVQKGKMSQKEADSQMEKINESMDQTGSTQMIFAMIGIVFGSVIYFVIIAFFFMLIARYALGGTGTYTASMIAYSMPAYIAFIQTIIVLLISITTDKMITGIHLAYFLNIDTQTVTGGILSKFDPFSIWYWYAISVGYAKLFKSENTKKYVITIMGIWLAFGILMVVASQYISFLKWFIR
ncbi:MAG: hypothetical protein HW421_742 [Ignavibacteria bacterium]|nr:hypothetical protein [Ignavibacteria bacterium]